MSNNKKQIRDLTQELDDMQHDWLANATRMKPIITKINTLWDREEKYWHQKSRIYWLKAGDANTKFFHLSTIQRRRRNTIDCIQDEDGRWSMDEIGVRRTFNKYFEKLFTTDGPRDMESVLSCMDCVINEEMNDTLLSPISLQEVKNVVYDMGALKPQDQTVSRGCLIKTFGSKYI